MNFTSQRRVVTYKEAGNVQADDDLNLDDSQKNLDDSLERPSTAGSNTFQTFLAEDYHDCGFEMGNIDVTDSDNDPNTKLAPFSATSSSSTSTSISSSSADDSEYTAKKKSTSSELFKGMYMSIFQSFMKQVIHSFIYHYHEP